MKIGFTIVLLLTVTALLVVAQKSSKSKSPEPSKTVHHKVSSKKITKTYSKSKKPTSKDVPHFKKTEKASGSSMMDELEVTEPPRHQERRQSEGKSGRWIYVEDVVGTPFEETYPSGQPTYRKPKKSHRQQYDWSTEEETWPAVRGPRPCPFRHPGGVSAGGCPYHAESVEFRSYPSQIASPCNQPHLPVPPCPYANPQPSSAQSPEPCPCPAKTQPSTQTQAYPTININTYSGAPVVNEAKIANLSMTSNDTTTDGATLKDEGEDDQVVEQEPDEKEVEEEEYAINSGEYSSCDDPELSEQIDDGYCYRTEL